MENLQTQIVSICTAIGIAILATAATWIVSKVKGVRLKILEPLLKQLDETLDNILLSILQNIYQTYTKNIIGTELWNEATACEAIQKAYDSLIKILPKHLLWIAKKAFENAELTLKEKIQLFYEKHKDQVNKTNNLL